MSRSNGRIKGRFALFCDYALTSSDGKLSVLGEFDQLYSINDDPILHKGFLVASFDGDPDTEATIDINLSNHKDDDTPFKGTLSIRFSSTGRANILVEFGSLPFKKFGIYEAVLSSKGEPIIKAQIRVSKVKQNAAAQA